MNRRLRLAVAGVGAGAALTLALAPGAAALAAHSVRPASAATVGDTVMVQATDRLTFEPDSVVIHVGDVVKWRNAGMVQHTVTADPVEATIDGTVHLPDAAEPFNSGLLAEGETFTYRFVTPGRYGYFCVPHEGAGMAGTVVVIDETQRAGGS